MTEISPPGMPGGTPEELRERAAAHDRAAADSFERCDTDGFVSQWAHGVTGELDRLRAKIMADNGYHRFNALYDHTGALVNAREVDGQYGDAWRMVDANGYLGRWLNPSRSQDWRKRLRANAAKGFFVGSVLLPARAELFGSGKGLAGAASVRAVAVRLYDDYRDYVILDNGSPSVSEDVIRAEYVRTISRHEELTDPEGVRARVINEQLARAGMWDAYRATLPQ